MSKFNSIAEIVVNTSRGPQQNHAMAPLILTTNRLPERFTGRPEPTVSPEVRTT